jgi:hypothetical protein
MLLLCIHLCDAQTTLITGRIADARTDQPLEGVSVLLLPMKMAALTNSQGRFTFKKPAAEVSGVTVSAIGYETRYIQADQLSNISLKPQVIELNSVTVASHAGDQFKPISKMDISLRGITNSQEVLRIVPGLFIGQHQGGGKAEQIFLRGFDCDHGTDISLNVDGLPINMVSHAHGQGFADSHFIIPETIEGADFKKGPYYAEKGDFCTTGYVDFHTKDALANNLVKVEGGMFNTYRVVGMANLLGNAAKAKHQSWYAAAEYRYSDSYFDNPQHFNRLNLFTKYNGQLSENTSLSLSASTLYSKWNASGQIPDRVVAEGIIGFYGALDPLEGGVTSRTNINAQLSHSLPNGDLIKHQLYYTYYTFDLHTNFTFYLVDTVNGDEIRQKESRNLAGYKGSYEHVGYIGNARLNTEGGLLIRADATHNTALSHTRDRFITLDQVKLGNITEINAAAYLNESLRLSDHFSINAGLRFDQFNYKYNNKLPGDSTLHGAGIYKADDHIISPKLSLYYHASERMEFYITTGKGFHSNDARAVVAQNGTRVLPAAYGTDLGTVFKPAKNVFINAALWYIYLQQEFVYGGDGGSVEFSGRTRRVGVDLSGRYQPISSLYFDVDVNYAHGRSIDDPKGQNYIPLAPIWSSTGGLTYTSKEGLNGSLRYRYLGDRPANEDRSIMAQGYLVTDMVLNYTKRNYEIGLTINNLLGKKWKETQFATETRMKGESQSVDEICFTPGTPFAANLHVTYYLK